MAGATAVVLDPDSEYEPLITLLGGSYVDLADTSINPLAVGRDLPVDEAAEVGEIATTEQIIDTLKGRSVGLGVEGSITRASRRSENAGI